MSVFLDTSDSLGMNDILAFTMSHVVSLTVLSEGSVVADLEDCSAVLLDPDLGTADAESSSVCTFFFGVLSVESHSDNSGGTVPAHWVVYSPVAMTIKSSVCAVFWIWNWALWNLVIVCTVADSEVTITTLWCPEVVSRESVLTGSVSPASVLRELSGHAHTGDLLGLVESQPLASLDLDVLASSIKFWCSAWKLDSWPCVIADSECSLTVGP